MPTKQGPEMVEIRKDFFVPKRELEAHEQRMSAGIEAGKRPDTMTPEEEEEWNISEHIRNSAQGTLEK